MDEIMIGKLCQHFPRFSYTVVEPGKAIEQFKHRVDRKDEFKTVDFCWSNMTYEEFCRSESESDRKFSFISLVHSAYYLDNLRQSLRCLMGSIKDGGVLLIMLNRGLFDTF